MILLVATICMKLDAVTPDCRTEVVRTEPTKADCARVEKATQAWLIETYAPEWLGTDCKDGTLG